MRTFRPALVVCALLAAGATTAESPATSTLTKEQAMDIWRAEQLIVRTSPEWHYTMFDTFPVVVMVNLHGDMEDLMGSREQFNADLDSFQRRHHEITVDRIMPPSAVVVVTVHSREAMLELLRDRAVKHAQPDYELKLQLNTALPMVNPLPMGLGGAGTMIAVIDTGILSTSPLLTTGKVAVVKTFNSCSNEHKDTQDRDGHGTVTAAVAAAAAPQARIAVLKAVDCTGKLSAQAAHAAQLWVYDNAYALNIVAVSMSYASSTKFAGACSTPMADMLDFLIARGTVPVAASGNDGWKTGLPEPACAPGALAVGMIASTTSECQKWEQYWAGVILAQKCVEYLLEAGKIPKLSNSGSRLALIAPGGKILAGGAYEYGTSIAAPFVAGAVAVAQTIYKRPASAMLAAMKIHPGSVLVMDSANNLSRPLLDITRLAIDTAEARPPGYVPGTPSGAGPATVATTTTTPVTLLTPPPVVIGGCSACHGI